MVKRLAKILLAQTPYRIVRGNSANRFQAIEVCLDAIKSRGFSPKIIIDGGAHIGSFSVAARSIFPNAVFHLVEPQPACCKPLEKLCAANGFIFHKCALAEKTGKIYLTRALEPSTGAHITQENGDSIPVMADTLDALFGSITRNDRPLLKLDLQGYELHALRGGGRFLHAAEVILTEVSFFAQAYEPSIPALISFLSDNAFQLYDIASLSGRSRDNRLRQGDLIFVRIGSQLLEDGHWE